MAAPSSDYKTIRTTIKNLIKDIVFYGGTLEQHIDAYRRSGSGATPNTRVKIFRSRGRSAFHESRLNKRRVIFVIRIMTMPINRESDAEDDSDYLTEEILTILENNRQAITAGTVREIYLEGDGLEVNATQFDDNYNYSDIYVQCSELVTAGN